MQYANGSHWSILAFLAAGLLALTANPWQAENAEAAEACVTEIECDTTNSYGAHFTGEVNDIHWEGDCVTQWDCVYDDGFQTRHYAY